MKSHNYFIYITTNPGKTVLYVGVTNDLRTRLEQHKANRGKPETFAGRYYCYNLLYYERYTYVQHAIEREKELKLLNRGAKVELIKKENPYLRFLKIDD
ncbi:GIY-YIG nuclease family protein [Pontibacter sp. SGAir0037]|uniref:GIY-YIG nuclease family protein n=1 Tax=Pontibacter sp. SGAir0037 TaxID=2571030 RepID=UPI0010CCD7F5|nr:GIY-YIG nuclease family protein [Pontibacter sp. SGAir0037]QCR24336.1 endonuclease [Pontibacter sp. SGAir0037]